MINGEGGQNVQETLRWEWEGRSLMVAGAVGVGVIVTRGGEWDSEGR